MSGDAGELERNLGFLEAMTLGGGTMIGAGIFILPGLAAEGAGPASALSFLLAGVVALLAALSLSELATGMPIAGGSYHYVNRALGGPFGSVVGWGMWTGLMFASAFYMIGFGQYVVEPLAALDGRALVVLCGLVGLAAIVALNVYGTDESSGAQNLMIGVEFAIVLAYVAIGAVFVEPANFREFAPTGPTGVVATTGTVFVTYLGFEIVATVAGEIENPGRLIPATMVLSVVGVTLLYVVVMLVSTGVIPYEELGGSLVAVSDVAAITMFGAVGVGVVTFAAAIAAISSSNSSILAASRVVFAMGRDGLMREELNATHDRLGTPHRAILATGAVTGLLVLAGLRVSAIVALLAQVASFSFLVTYALVHVAVVVFRRADPEAYDPEFRLPGATYPAVPVVGVAAAALVVSQMDPLVIGVGTGIVAFGVVWYLGFARTRAVEDGLLDEAFGDAVASGRRRLPGGATTTATEPDPYRVVVPVANPATQRGLLRLAATSARSHGDERTPELVAINVVEADPSPERNVESDRLRNQRALLKNARRVAEGMAVDLRTRALVEPDAGAAIVAVAEDVDADQVLLGWDGRLDRDEHVFGPTVDAVFASAPCDVSVVRGGGATLTTPVALVGAGPHAPVAASRAAEFAPAGTVPTLLNVQRPAPDGNPTARGRRTIEDVAERAGLATGEYEPAVVVDADVPAAILSAVEGYDAVCAGLSERGGATPVPLGSIAERLSREASGTVCVARGAIDPDERDGDGASPPRRPEADAAE